MRMQRGKLSLKITVSSRVDAGNHAAEETTGAGSLASDCFFLCGHLKG